MSSKPPPAEALAQPAPGETFEQFRKSFFYGSRTDLLFKFLEHMSDEDGAEFLRGLLARLGETVDDGDLDRLMDYLLEWNVRGYAREHEDRWQYPDGPFTPLAKPLAQSTVALLTTTGHFVAGDDPAPLGEPGMTQAQAVARAKEFGKLAPALSRIPVDTPAENLRVRHPGYDTRGAERDFNVALPLDGMRQLAQEGVIGALLPDAYSFVGLAAQTPLLNDLAPKWAGMLKERGVDGVVLVPV